MKTNSKLQKLKMPPRAEIDASELDMGPESEPMGDEMMGEGEGESGEAAKTAGPDAFKEFSDDELLAEVKKRGLMGQLSEEAPEEKARDKAMGASEMEAEEEEYMS